MRQKPNTHNFTYNGKPVGGRALCGVLGMTNPTLYGIANKIKSDVGEEIKAYQEAHAPGARGRKMVYEGEVVLTATVAKEVVGISTTLFNMRLDKYGEDCETTYYPGRIPVHLQNKKPKPKSNAPENRGNAEWQALNGTGSRASKSIKIGDWERKNLKKREGRG